MKTHYKQITQNKIVGCLRYPFTPNVGSERTPNAFAQLFILSVSNKNSCYRPVFANALFWKSIYHLLNLNPFQGSLSCWSLSQLTLGEGGRDTLDRSPVRCGATQPHNLTIAPRDNLKSSINLWNMFSAVGGNWRVCKLCEWGTPCCETRVLT